MRPELCPQFLVAELLLQFMQACIAMMGFQGQGLARVEYYLKAGRL